MNNFVVKILLPLLLLAFLAAFLATSAVQAGVLEAPPGAHPVPVRVGLYVTNLIGVNEPAESFHIRGFIHATWKDSRLAYEPRRNGKDTRVFDAGRIWIPALNTANALGSRKTIGVNVRARPDGTVDYLEDFEAEFSTVFSLRSFPFDRQSLLIVFEPLLDERGTLNLGPDAAQSGIGKQDWVSLAQYDVQGLTISEGQARLGNTGSNIKELDFNLGIKRHHAFYVWKVFLPLIIMLLISYSMLWLPANNLYGQLLGTLNSTLTMVAFLLVISGNLPKIPYLTYSDAFFFTSFVFAFLAIIDVVAVHVLDTKNAAFADRVRRRMRWVFPAACLACHTAAFWIFVVR